MSSEEDLYGKKFGNICIQECVASSSFYGAPKINNGVLTKWETRLSGEATLLLKIKNRYLISNILIDNKGTSVISVDLGLNPKKEKSFVPVLQERRIPHGRVTNLSIGHLPGKYIRITCHHGAPISLTL
mmetsp:Transcript_14523/g.18844  ORF Transcript_14523/g.18844 Transcript_14523/m.18844 type:complete len:129 (-) Transcript_14523:5-391(-)